MSFKIFDKLVCEPSQLVGFSGNLLDRHSEDRNETCLVEALAQDATRMMVFAGDAILLHQGSDKLDPYFPLGQAEALKVDPSQSILLGHDDEGAVLAASSLLDIDHLPDGLIRLEYRPVYTQELIDRAALGTMAQAISLMVWNRTHRFCGLCGGPCEMRLGGYKRVCEQCGREHFPRTDPVVIMLVLNDERCLLGRSPHFERGVYSALAGFVEPGETIENAVRREVLEESSIRLGRVIYHASQPWPFPHTLMIGCYGEALDQEIQFDGRELEDCRWFDRDELRQMIAGTHPEGLITPTKSSIAFHLMQDWALGD